MTTIQNPLVAFTFITSSLLLSSTCVTAQSVNKLGQVALDAINISIAEVNRAKVFIDSIPNLKSLRNVPVDQLTECVGDLTKGISDVVMELLKLNRLDSWHGATWGLEKMVNNVASFDGLCNYALGDVDGIYITMIHRKIQDIVLLTNDVIFRVSKASV